MEEAGEKIVMDTQTILSFIGVIATISVPFILYYMGNKKKRLVFKELQNLSVVDVKTDFKDKIEIKYGGKPVDNLFVSTAKIKNKGTLPIKKSEIIKPIEITFNKKILDCNVIEVSPKGIDISLSTNPEGNSIECEFNLLNPRDYFTLQFISLEKLSTPEIIPRIEGLSQIDIASNTDEENALGKFKMWLLAGPLIFLFGGWAIFVEIQDFFQQVSLSFPTFPNIIYFYIFMLIMIMTAVITEH